MYNYKKIKKNLFTEKGQVTFTTIRDKIHKILKTSGAITMEKAIEGISGDSWEHMACVDRMVELGELREICHPNQVAGQYRIFILDEEL